MGAWNWFAAIRVAIVLFILWAALSALTTLIPQGQEQAYYVQKYGRTIGGAIMGLGFHHAYTSFPYVAVVALFLTSLFVCSVRRTKRAWRSTVKAKLDFQPGTIEKMRNRRVIVPGGRMTSQDVASQLRRLGFAVKAAGDSEGRQLFLARRGTIAPWGMAAVHFSLLIIFVGAFIGRTPWFGGFSSSLIIREGETAYDQPAHMAHSGADWKPRFDFGIRLVDFWIDRDQNGAIKDYTSRVEVVEGDKVVENKDIEVNKPLFYKGVKFYQSSYLTEGAKVEVTTPEGETQELLFPNSNNNSPDAPYVPDMMSWPQIALKDGTEMRFFAHGCVVNSEMDLLPGRRGESPPPGMKMRLYLVEQKKDATQWPQIGWVSADQPTDFQGLKFRVAGLVDATVLSVRRDPGMPVVWFGCALAVLGLLVGLYVRETTMMVCLSQKGNRSELLAGASAKGDSQAAEKHLNKLERAIAGGK